MRKCGLNSLPIYLTSHYEVIDTVRDEFAGVVFKPERGKPLERYGRRVYLLREEGEGGDGDGLVGGRSGR